MAGASGERLGARGRLLQMEAFKGGRAVYRAQFTLDRFNRYAIAFPQCLARGLAVAYSSTGWAREPPAQHLRAAPTHRVASCKLDAPSVVKMRSTQRSAKDRDSERDLQSSASDQWAM